MISNQISYIALWSKDLDKNRGIFANLLGIPILDVGQRQSHGLQPQRAEFRADAVDLGALTAVGIHVLRGG